MVGWPQGRVPANEWIAQKTEVDEIIILDEEHFCILQRNITMSDNNMTSNNDMEHLHDPADVMGDKVRGQG